MSDIDDANGELGTVDGEPEFGLLHQNGGAVERVENQHDQNGRGVEERHHANGAGDQDGRARIVLSERDSAGLWPVTFSIKGSGPVSGRLDLSDSSIRGFAKTVQQSAARGTVFKVAQQSLGIVSDPRDRKKIEDAGLVFSEWIKAEILRQAPDAPTADAPTEQASKTAKSRSKKQGARRDASVMDPGDAARKIIKGQGARPLQFWRGNSLQYQGDHYRILDKGEFRALVTRQLDCDFHHLGTHAVGNVIEHLRAHTLLAGDVEPNSWLANAPNNWAAAEIIVAKNGMFHLPSIGTGSIARRSATPDFFNLNALDYEIDESAPPPSQWLQFLNELWPDDAESIEALRRWYGYMVAGGTWLQKIAMLIGPPRSGKGVLARVLTGLVGKRNVAGPTMAGLATNFGLWGLLDKTVAIISDARLSGRTDQAIVVERLLSISGEDSLLCDRKMLSPVTCRIPARLTILSNELPKLGDSSGAMAKRMILLRLTESFYGREDPTLTDRLLTELPGIFLWSIDGWRRLRAEREIVQPASADDMVADLQSLASPIGAFVRERCAIKDGYVCPVADLYAEWKAWCEANGRTQPGTQQTFGRDLMAAVPSLKRTQPRDDDGGRYRAYEGIGILGQAVNTAF